MASIKISRISEDIRKELVGIFREVKDLSNDLSHCKVYVSAVEGVEKTKESVAGLKSAAGYIRRTVSGRLHLRKTPEFHFVADDSIAYSANINRILEEENRAHPEWALDREETSGGQDDDLL